MKAMIKIIILAVATFLMMGCEYKTVSEIKEAKRLDRFNIVVIDSCEYVSKSIGGYNGILAHKGNCRFCAERKKQELEALVKQIKEK